ncbi:MAG: long-chain fatty acid--CoA ligase [Sphingomonadaceae bacterium]|nr:long-chain fatty acid--CoA ligase [Sphingomonadaceae bacterium]
MLDLPALISAVLKIDPTAPAMEFEGRWESWGGLATRMGEIDRLIGSLGLDAETRVGIMLRNRLPHLAALYTLIATERCMVTLNPMYPEAVLVQEISRLELPLIIGGAADLARDGIVEAAREVGTALVALPEPWRGEAEIILAPNDRTRLARAAPGVMIEMLTSGTTGLPKRVSLTRQAFEHSFATTLKAEGALDAPPTLRPGIQISAAPLTHIGGVWGSLTAICLGRKLVLIEKFEVAVWLDAIVRHQPRSAALTAAALRMVLDANVSREALSSLAAITAGAAPTDPAIVDAFRERYGIPVLTNYGATEFAGPVARWSLADFEVLWAEKRGSVGRLHHNVEARIVDDTSDAVLPPGKEGVLELRSPQLIDPRGWLRTSDRARIDGDGFLWVTGRADGVIIRGGFKVSPEEVVQALEAHPSIREAVVVGVPDARLGRVPAAAIMLARGASPPSDAELSEFLRFSLAPYQIPVRFALMDDVPRTASMKPVLPEIVRLLSGDTSSPH